MQLPTSYPVEPLTPTDIEGLFKTHYRLLFRYARHLLGDDAEAQDAVSEVFVALWTKREALRISRSPRSYLLAMVKHQALQQKRQATLAIRRGDEYAQQQPAAQPSPQEQYQSAQTVSWLEGLIEELPPLRREIIELRVFGLRNREIAEALGLSEKKVEYQLGQAVEMLRFQLRKHAAGEAVLPGAPRRGQPEMALGLLVNLLVMLS